MPRKYKLKVTRKGKKDKTVTVTANSLSAAIDEYDPGDDVEDIDVISTEEIADENGGDDDSSSESEGGVDESDNSGEVEIISIEEVDGSEGSFENGEDGESESDEDEEGDAEDNEGDASDDVEPQQGHFFYRKRGKRK